MNKLYKRAVTGASLLTYVLTGCLVPAESVFAGNITRNVGGQTISYPAPTWSPVASATFSPSDETAQVSIGGDQATVSLNVAARSLGWTASQVSDVVNSLPTSGTMVFGRFSPLNNELRVDILKTERTGTTVSITDAQFTPQFGNQWAAQRTFLSPAEKAATDGPGPNPFQRYDQGDGTFHNIPLTDARAIVGAAVRYSGAELGLIESTSSRLAQTSHHSGGWLHRTYYIDVDGYSKPQWFIGLPATVLQDGTDGGICVVDANPCPASKAMLSGVKWQQMTGGNMPEGEDHVYHWEESKGSWTVLGMLVLMTVMTAVTAGIGTSILDTSGLLNAVMGTNTFSFGIGGANWAVAAGGVGTLNAGAYIGYTQLFTSQGGLMAPESGYYGNTGINQNAGDTTLPNGQEAINSPDFLQNGAIGNLGHTTNVPPPPASIHETALRSDEENSAVMTTPQDTGLTAATAGFSQIQPSPTDNYDFNQVQFIQDTQ